MTEKTTPEAVETAAAPAAQEAQAHPYFAPIREAEAAANNTTDSTK